jgi:hypothetical protein
MTTHSELSLLLRLRNAIALIARATPRWARGVAHAVVLVGSAALLSSLAGAGVIASPLIGPLLILGTAKTHGLLRMVYSLLLALLLFEAVAMAAIALGV